MKRFVFNKIVLLFCFYSFSGFSASEAEFSAAINIAGRQRMLTQKMAKEALLVKLGIDADKNKENLTATMTLFEESLKSLQGGDASKSLPAPPSKDVEKQLSAVEALWTPYKTALSAQQVEQVAERSLPILKTMNTGVKKYEVASIKAGIKGKGKVINVAGRQRMLTQKMAKEVLLVAAGVSPDKNRKQLKSTSQLFSSSLDALQNGNKRMRIQAAVNSDIKAQLEIVAGLWKEYSGYIEQVATATGKLEADLLKKVAEINPKILVEMHKAVQLYEKTSS